jgi:UDP-GlcNAc:undecaprenyl-phosphate GlcNAc-1-phosphate transferase
MVYVTAFLFSFSVSLGLTAITRKAMLKLGIVDKPRDDRWNQQPVALMGGIAIFISFTLVASARIELRPEVPVILLGGAVIFALGVLDDLLGTHAKVKFAVQIFVAFGVACFGVASKILPYHWLNISVTVLWIVGLTNALNLLDNIDGLSSGITIIAALAILGLALQRGEAALVPFCLALAGSCFGFLRYNFIPATIFMGDCGSMFLGYILATLAILAGWQHSSPLAGAFLSPFLILGVAIFDTTLVTVLRLKNGIIPWRGGRDHSSHRLVSILGGSERGAVLFLYGVGILAGGLGLLLGNFTTLMAILTAIAFLLAMFIFGIRLAKVECYNIET